jgi:AbiV family abortive infection protein
MSDSKKNFMNISQKECLQLYPEIIKVSDKHWKKAKRDSQSKDYGSATLYLISSTEELIKAMVIFLDGKGFELRKIKGVNYFFNNHNIRFVVSFYIFALNLIMEDMISFIIKVRENPNALREYLKNKEESQAAFIAYALETMKKLAHEVDLFSNLKIIREGTLYSNMNGEFSSPISESEENYKMVYEKLTKVRWGIKQLMESFNTENLEEAEAVSNIKKMLKADKMDILLSPALNKLAKSKSDVFVNMKNELLKQHNELSGTPIIEIYGKKA